MVGIDDIAADPSSSCERGDRGRSGCVVGEGAKSFAQTGIGPSHAAGLRSG